MNVESLTRGTFVDYFYCTDMPCHVGRSQQHLRLSNGFVVPDSITITAPDGTIVTAPEPIDANLDTGIVKLDSWSRGLYSVAYTSGFLPTDPPDPIPVDGSYDPENRVLQNVPEFLKGITIGLMIMWYRTTMLQPKVSKEISYGQVDAALRRELYARIYEKYDRPRVAVTFSERMDRVS